MMMLDRIALIALTPLTLAGGAFGWVSTGVADTAAPAGANSVMNPGIRRSADGLFRITARIDAASVPMVVDTGATRTMLSAATARRLHLLAAGQVNHGWLHTAGGATPYTRVRITAFAVGPYRIGHALLVVPLRGATIDVLGQDVLMRLRGVRVVGDRLYFE